MTPLRLLPLVLLAFIFASCATTNSPSRSATLQKLEQLGIDSRTYAKIVNGRVLDYSDIQGLLQKSVPSPAIIAYLKSTHAPYKFTNSQLLSLSDSGASSDLVNYLGQSTGFYEASKRNQTGGKKWDNHPYFNDPYFFGPAPFAWGFPGEWDNPMALGFY